jgi:gas vesicle protein
MTDYERLGEYQPGTERSTLGVALTFLLVGLGIGALSALLYAPRTGKQMRRTLKRRYEDARDTFGDWTDSAGSAFERGTDWAGGLKDRARSKVMPIARAVRGQ